MEENMVLETETQEEPEIMDEENFEVMELPPEKESIRGVSTGVKLILGGVALIGAAAGGIYAWRKRRKDIKTVEEVLDKELDNEPETEEPENQDNRKESKN